MTKEAGFSPKKCYTKCLCCGTDHTDKNLYSPLGGCYNESSGKGFFDRKLHFTLKTMSQLLNIPVFSPTSFMADYKYQYAHNSSASWNLLFLLMKNWAMATFYYFSDIFSVLCAIICGNKCICWQLGKLSIRRTHVIAASGPFMWIMKLDGLIWI